MIQCFESSDVIEVGNCLISSRDVASVVYLSGGDVNIQVSSLA